MSRFKTARRDFLQSGSKAVAAAAVATGVFRRSPVAHGVAQSPDVEVLNPRGKVPLSFIIDDSTCLVNMGHYCMPQFAEAWPERENYRKPWKSWPREIPDSFVQEFGEWCAEHGVKGKYSVVPFPACVGWLDRELPGWSRRELQASLKLVRELMLPDWDIHPEMITHTRVIELKTGRPLEEISPATMENSFPQEKKSVDELASYLSYALQILQNCDLPCEGITTPGGFGNGVEAELSLAVQEAIRNIDSRVEVPHYFKYVSEGDENTDPVLEQISGRGTPALELTVNLPAGTGDWFGGWDGDRDPEPERYISRDATAGRLVELIERGQPGTFLCHWPGMYTQGTKKGFEAFKQVVRTVNDAFSDRTVWMKLSEIARYWAAKELTEIYSEAGLIQFTAPFTCPGFTISIRDRFPGDPSLRAGERTDSLQEVSGWRELKPGTWLREREKSVLCFDLAKGNSVLRHG